MAFPLALHLLRGVVVVWGKQPGEVKYRRVESLLSVSERSFYGVLRSLAPADWVIAFKVRLVDIIEPEPSSRGQWQRAFNKVSAKHVDFLLCRADDLSPLLVIELDDVSHTRQKRAERDDFADAALRSAGVPVLRTKARRAYQLSELREKIRSAMQPCAVRPRVDAHR